MINSNQNSAEPLSPSYLASQSQQETPTQPDQHETYIVEQRTRPYWESGETSFGHRNQDQLTDYYGENCATEQSSTYHYEVPHNYTIPHKQKGISSKINRFVLHFRILRKFYKQQPIFSEEYGSDQDFEHVQRSSTVNSNRVSLELTADELALCERYSKKDHIKCVKLGTTDQTEPIGICIHHETNKIYVCDVGRSVVEIFDMNGELQHSINHSSMTKFQPTAIIVALDGTIIIASYFNNCLHKYSPDDSSNNTNPYSYKQYTLGKAGNQLHEFDGLAGIAIDNSDGYIYVCDRGNCRIQVIDSGGLCERVIELFSKDNEKCPMEPGQIALLSYSDQLVCIINTGDAICFCSKYSDGQVYVDPLYIVDKDGLGLRNASGIAVDTHGRIFISDTNHNRIVICRSDGDCITTFGTEGERLGELKQPWGLDVTPDGTVIVTDPGNKRLQLFGLIPEEPPTENNLKAGTSDTNNALADDTERNFMASF